DDDYVAVINTASNSVETTISVVEGPEKLLEENGKIFVAHKGGWGYGNSISVINAVSNSVTSITVADIPDSLDTEGGFLYVLCSGRESWSGIETDGALVKIN